MSKEQRRDTPTYPEPLIINSEPAPHSYTFILLHGRGSNAETFGPALLDHTTPKYESLRKAFPHAKFVFPTAAFRRATIYKRTPITQWFDNWHLTQPTEREDLQVMGLRESCAYLHGLIEEAVAEVGAERVVVGGLSQGCATLLTAYLLWRGPSLGGWFGMCGWLPFRLRMQEAIDSAAGEKDEDDVFEQDDSEQGSAGLLKNPSLKQVAVASLRDELDLGPSQPETLDLARPALFLGHGTLDDRVPVSLGREASSLLTQIGMDVTWREYAGLGHWYSAEMIEHIIDFLRGQLPGDESAGSRKDCVSV